MVADALLTRPLATGSFWHARAFKSVVCVGGDFASRDAGVRVRSRREMTTYERHCSSAAYMIEVASQGDEPSRSIAQNQCGNLARAGRAFARTILYGA